MKQEIINNINLENITVFEKLNYTPTPGINVLLGMNGTGKTHLLKIIYVLHSFFSTLENKDTENKQRFAERISEVFNKNFLVEGMGRLSSRIQGHKHSTLQVSCTGSDQHNLSIDFSTRSTFADVDTIRLLSLKKAVFIPSREILGMFEGFLAAYKLGNLRVEELYADLAAYLGVKGAPGKLSAELRRYVTTLENILDAQIEFDAANEKFYIKQSGKGRIEIGLSADGHKKIGTIMHLIKNGTLHPHQTICIDEPEANMNPSAAKPITKLLYELAKNGHQIYVSTHDYFVLKYLEILKDSYAGVDVQFLNLYRDNKKSKFVQYETSESVYDLEYNRIFEEFETVHQETMKNFWG